MLGLCCPSDIMPGVCSDCAPVLGRRIWGMFEVCCHSDTTSGVYSNCVATRTSCCVALQLQSEHTPDIICSSDATQSEHTSHNDVRVATKSEHSVLEAEMSEPTPDLMLFGRWHTISVTEATSNRKLSLGTQQWLTSCASICRLVIYSFVRWTIPMNGIRSWKRLFNGPSQPTDA